MPSEVTFEQANTALRDAVEKVIPIFKKWGVRQDSLDEYWHTVYHLDRDNDVTTHRIVPKHSIGEKQANSAKRAFKLIITESKKPNPRITDFDEAESVLNDLADALRFAGFELNDKGNWIINKKTK